MRLSLFVLAFVLFTGCSERLIDEPMVPVTEPPPPGVSVPTHYVKGPAEMFLGQESNFRSQSAPGATQYVWRIAQGPADALQLPDAPERLVTIRATGLAEVVLEVEARSAEGELISVGQIRISIYR